MEKICSTCPEETATVTSTFTATDDDAPSAELVDMGFPLHVSRAAIKESGPLYVDELITYIRNSEDMNTSAESSQKIPCHVESDVTGPDEKENRVLANELDNPRPEIAHDEDLSFTIEDFPCTRGISNSVLTDDRERSVRGRQTVMTYSASPPDSGLEGLGSSGKPALLERLIEMGCRPDVAEKAYEIYGNDPLYTSEDERVEVMCDYIVAVELNENEIEEQAPGMQGQEFQDDVAAGLDHWFSMQEQGNSTAELQTDSHQTTARSLSHIDFPAQGHSGFEMDLECSNEEYQQGGYYSYIREEDPEQKEWFYEDLEEQEEQNSNTGQKRKNYKDGLPPTISRKKMQVPKFLVGSVKRQIIIPHYTRMTGYGVPGSPIIPRVLPHHSLDGPPYFYFENVATMPGDEWDTISRHLFDIEPEFVNSYHFTVCKRPRGYVHNLPVEGRLEVLPRGPRTIRELVPYASSYWPTWDDRTIFNCVCTNTATLATFKPIAQLLNSFKAERHPPPRVRRKLMDIIRMYNLVWIGPGRLARLKVEELEVCMGFDKDHTRPINSTNEQYKGLGNSFQVHTVGYHLSVLKNIFPQGLNVLSLFSGIGGAEVALHKLGIPVNVAVCVEIDPKVRRVIEHWWEVTNQSGKLITRYENVNDLDHVTLQVLLVETGGFDLVIGGSPCSNLSAKNRFSRMGLGGKASVAFFEYSRILKDVRTFGLRCRSRGSRA